MVFLMGCVMGMLCFLWVYGIRVLDPTYDAWLFGREFDLRQHYIGFCHFRMSDWHFPIGLIDTLSYPTKVSVLFTDSIPILALLFKALRGILPLRFQYFGIFGLISFMLMGGISSSFFSALLRTASVESAFAEEKKDASRFMIRQWADILSVLMSVFFILGFTVLDRMFYQTALGAQWILVLAMYIWITRDGYSGKKVVAVYAGMGALCVLIHVYFVPMVGSILLIASVSSCIRKKSRAGIEASGLLSFCGTGLLLLFVLGGFYGNTAGAGRGFGGFSSNLNAFFNPLYGSALLKPLDLYQYDQYEGYAYLGIGLIIALILAMVFLFGKMRKNGLSAFTKAHKWFTVALCVLVADFLLAVLPTVALGKRGILVFRYPEVIEKALGIFRANGRFIWVPWYVIAAGSLLYTLKLLSEYFGKKEKGKAIVLLIMVLILGIQVLDTTKVVSSKQEYFKSVQTYTSPWDNMPVDVSGSQYREYVYLFNDIEKTMDTAYYAYLNGKSVNNYYFARSIDNEVNADIEKWRQELSAGIVRDDVVYIRKKQDQIAESYEGLTWYEIGEDLVAGVKK